MFGLLLFSINAMAGGVQQSPKGSTINNSLVINLTFTLSDYNGFNVSCTGASDGTIDLEPADGVAPYTYIWSTGAVSQDLTGVPAGTYTVTVTDDVGEVQTGSVTLTEPSGILINLDNIVSDGCGGVGEGEVNLTVAGSVPNYSYQWNSGASAEDLTGVVAGDYTITVTDNNGCTAQSQYTVPEVVVMSLSASVTDVDCGGANTGEIDLTVTNGNPGFNYLWSSGDVTEDLVGFVAGVYTVTVTDNDGCTIEDNFTIAEPPALSLGISTLAASCFGAATGSVDLTVSGGTPVITYLWSNGSTNEDLTNVLAGTYTVTVTDANLCTATTSATITQPTALNLSTSVTNVACNGGSTGAIDLTVSGGTAGYTYSWSSGASTQDLSGVAAGTYTVTVTDANLCTATTNATITQPAVLNLSTSVTNVACNGGSTGAIDLTVSGGTAGYTYSWSSGASTQDLSGVVVGTYTVTVTDANLCTATTSATITQPTALNLSTSVTNVACNGGSTGAIDLTVSGGTTGYTYSWSNGASSQDLSGVTAGTFTVTVTDANLCTATTSATITQPTALNLSTSVTNVACNGASTGAIDLTVSGGTAGYTYSWSSGASTQDLSGVTAGTYTVTVTDANLCTATTSATITQPTALNLSTSVTNVACNGGSTGAIDLTVSGGTTGYTYSWSSGASTQDLSGVTAGTYTVTVTDANLCTATTSATIIETSGISISFVPVSGTCNASNGSVTALPLGGIPLYTYLWNTGATTQVITGLPAGTYTVTVTDLASCTASSSVVVGNSGSPVVTANLLTNPSCNGGTNGSIDINVSGGSPLYTYLWSTGAITQDINNVAAGTYTVTVTDLNFCVSINSFTLTEPAIITATGTVSDVLCNGGNTGSIDMTVSGGTSPYTYLWSNGSSNQDPTGLTAASYTVTITDFNSCTRVRSFIVAEPSVLTVAASSTQTGCGVNTGTLSASGNGGAGSFSYLWSNGATTANQSNIGAGTYTVTVTDLNGCTAIDVVGVTAANGPVISNSVITDVTCNAGVDGAINITVTGGTPGYSYSWSSGATSQDLTGITAGTYTVTVTDLNSCSVSAAYTVGQPLAVTSTAVITNVLCFGDANGSINMTPSGGNGTFSYLWSNGAITQDISSLLAGTYTVTITDGNSCTGQSTYTVTQPNNLTSSVVITDPLCNGDATGSINLNVLGGTTPYSYLWSNGFTGQDPTLLLAGTYTVTITDFNGCTRVRISTVTNPPAITATLSTSGANCGSLNGTASVAATGGTGTLTYLWNTGATTNSISGLAAGNYTVTVTDANSCSLDTTMVVASASGPVIASATIDSVNCAGGNDGAIDITISSGTAPYTYLWSNGATTQDITGLNSGTYTVTVTDDNLCTATDSYVVQESSSLFGSFSQTPATCNQANGSLSVAVSGGNPGYTYLWSNSSTSSSLSNVVANTYTVTVTDFYGCTGIFSSILSGTGGPVIDSAVIQNVLCNGSATGAIDLFVSGGSNPISYLWSNGTTTQDLSGITNGVYTVTVTDGSGCTARRVNTVTQPPFLSAAITTLPSFCGLATGQASVNPGGGTPGYSILWSNGQTTATITNLTAGTYSVTVTDQNGCTRRRNAVVSLSNGPVITLLSQVDVLCNGTSTGSLDIDVAGGVAPYSYVWSSGQTTQDITGLSAGTYTVFVTDDVSCSDSATFVIVENAGFTVSAAVQDASCGLANGSITLTVGGATPGYSYLWSNGQTSATATGLASGSYTVTVSDANSCDTSLVFAVGSLGGPAVAIDSTRDIRCFGINNGRIYITASGGSPTYSYLWNDGSTTQDRFGLSAGTYTVTITDAGGCTATNSATLIANTAIVPNFSTVQASCNQSNGSATVNPSGGVGPYSLLWETGANTNSITGLSAGVYVVTITDDVGCTKEDSVAVTNSGSPTVQLQNQTLPSCFAGSNGSLTISITGGTTPYTILWSNGSTTTTASGLAAGTYAVTVTDNVGCIDLKSFTLTQPDSLAISFVKTNANCGLPTGGLSASAAGGTGGVTYLWSTGATTNAISSVVAGLYTVTVTDQNSCTRVDTASINNIAGPELTLDLITDVSCNGGSNGAVAVSTSGGTNPNTYQWSSGQQTEDISNVPAGNYLLIVTDGAGCKDTLIATVRQPAAITLQSTVIDAACNNANGSIVVTPSGGTPGYTYLWSTGSTTNTIQNVVAGNYTVTITDLNSCTYQQVIAVNNLNGPSVSLVSMVPVTCFGGADGELNIQVQFGTAPFTYLWSNGDATQNLQNAQAGIYTLTVTDDNNCVTIFSDTITSPDPISLSATITDASCDLANGIIVLTASGGTAPYTYLWQSGQASSTISGLFAGIFDVTVTDDAGCTFDSSFTIINSGVPNIVANTIDSVTCFGGNDGSIDLTTAGGVQPYIFTWINTSQTTEDVTNLTAGFYSVIVTDFTGCTSSQSYTIGQPTQLNIGFPVIQNAACGQANGFVTVSASGGVPGYSYLWSNGSVNDTISNLIAGSYTVTVTDYLGCSQSSIANISNLTGPSITSVDSVNVTCFGGADGSIDIVASGVSQPFTYSWSTLPDTTPSVSGLSAGSYTLTVTDNAGCIAVRTVVLTQPAAFVINSVIPQNNPPYNISCNGLTDGSLNLSVNGGTAPYSFVWSNGAITQNLLNIPAGVFTVVITDDNNCTATSSFTLTEPPLLIADAGSDVIVCGQASLQLSAVVPVVGIGYWQVISSDGQIQFSDSTLPASTITGMGNGDNVLQWTITDGICSDTDLVVITNASAIEAIAGINRRICGSDVTLNATRPEFGYGYWTALTPGVTLADSAKAFSQAFNLSVGNNVFLWTVVNGTCRDSALVTITRKDTLDCLAKIQMPTAFSPNFDGFNDFLIIKGLEEYPDNQLEVYNRWGQLVYSKDSYLNDWYGLDAEGYPLPDATYFIIVKVRFINKVYNTYLDIRR
jgi:gliding motility-associated-like protein